MSIILTRVEDDHEPQARRCGSIVQGYDMVPVRRAVALVWSHSESATRMAQARAHAAEEGYTVRVMNGRDLLDRARAAALAAYAVRGV